MSGESFKLDKDGGPCLLCLDSTNSNGSKFVDIISTNGHLLDAPSTAIKGLLRYLKVDMGKIFMKLRNFSSSDFQRLVTGGPEGGLSVSLCSECSSVTKHFFELFQAFETIRLQLDFCVRQLHDFISKGDKVEDRIPVFQQKRIGGGKEDPGDGGGFLDDAAITEQLRREILEKCSLKLVRSFPQVVIHKCDDNRVVPDLGEQVEEISSSETADPTFVLPSSSKRATSLLRRKRKRAVPKGLEEKFVQVGDMLECTECGKMLRDMASFKRHFYRHGNGNQRPRKCFQCGKIFSDRSKLDAHQITSHTMEYFSCQIPPTVSEQQLEATIISFVEKAREELSEFGGGGIDHHGKKQGLKIKCPFCSKCLSPGSNLRKHFLRLHLTEIVEHADNGVKGETETCVKKEDPSTRVFSSVKFTRGGHTHSRLRIGQRKADKFRNCEHCGRSFAEYGNLRRHLISEHSYKHFEHLIPSNTVSERGFEHALAKMMTVQVKPKPGQVYNLTCSVCENGFRDRCRLRMHLLLAHFNKVLEKAITIAVAPRSGDKTLPVDTESAPVVDFIVEDGVRIKIEKHEENAMLGQEDNEITVTEPFLVKVEPDQEIKMEVESDENFVRSRSTSEHLPLPHTAVKARRRLPVKTAPIKCEFCGKLISSPTNLQLHKLQVHPIQLYADLLPPGVSKSGLNLAIETIIAEDMSSNPSEDVNKSIFKCPFCERRTATERPKLKLHILECHVENVAKKLSQQHHGQHRRGAHLHLAKKNMPSSPLPGSRKCSHCGKYIRGTGGNLRKHEMLEHALIIYRDHLPPGISKEDFESALASLVKAKIKVLPKEKNEPRAFTECTLCLKKTRNHSSELRFHMLRCHIDQVATNVEHSE